jgi:thiol-disulfide isomerase/thioredoxin
MKVIKFSAPWCGPCKVYAETFKKIQVCEEFKNDDFLEINVEEDDDALTDKYSIKSVPTTIVLNENSEVKKIVGAISFDSLKKQLLEIKNN